jgi:hypothetical protein
MIQTYQKVKIKLTMRSVCNLYSALIYAVLCATRKVACLEGHLGSSLTKLPCITCPTTPAYCSAFWQLPNQVVTKVEP